MISNDNDLAEAVERVSRDLADIQKYLGQNNHPRSRIRFPRGYLRNAVAFRQQLWYLKDETLKRNLAYAHILSDVFRWLINRTDLSLTAQEMVIKEAVCLMGAICESLTRGVALGEGVCGISRRFKPRCEDLRDASTSRTKPVTRFTCCGMRAKTNIFSWPRLGSTKNIR